MRKRLCAVLAVILLFTSIPATALAGELSTPKLDVPEFKVPDNMPDAFSSLRDKYDSAIEGMKKQGLDVNNYKDGIGELTAPEGFGKGPDGMSSAEDIFKERYGDMWNERPVNSDFANQNLKGKEERVKEWEENHPELGERPSFDPLPELEDLPEFTLPKLKELEKDVQLTKKTLTSFAQMSDSEFNNYISNMEKKYMAVFNQKQPGEIAFEQMANVPAFQVTNKWADLMKSPSEVMDEYSFLTPAQRADLIANRSKPAGFDEINSTTLDDLNQKYKEKTLLGKLQTLGKNLLDKGKETVNKAGDSLKNLFNISNKNDQSIGKKLLDKGKEAVKKTGDFFKNLFNKNDQSKEYKDIYKKYYDKGSFFFKNKEQDKQRQQILDVFEKYDIYDRNKDRKKASDPEYMGKLIKDNMDLLKKKIPGFKSFK